MRVGDARKHGIGAQLWEHRPPDPSAVPGRIVNRRVSAAASQCAAFKAAPDTGDPRVRAGTGPGVRPSRARRTAAAPAPELPAPPLEAGEERLLLESKAMDLFGTGQSAKPAVCPECHHELLKVVCLGTAVRVCIMCKGTWLPYSVVQEFAQTNDWFRQLGPAFQLASEKKPVE